MSKTSQGKQHANVVTSLLPNTIHRQRGYIEKMIKACGSITDIPEVKFEDSKEGKKKKKLFETKIELEYTSYNNTLSENGVDDTFMYRVKNEIFKGKAEKTNTAGK